MNTFTRYTARLGIGVAGTALALTALAACGSSNSSTSTSGASSMPSMSSSTSGASGMSGMSSPSSMSSSDMQGMATITIKSYKYTGTTTVAPGTTVMVTNQDSVAHTVTADQGSAFDVTVPAGGMVHFTAPTKPGTYAYHCTYHAEMHGTLTVS
jgi:plastocyanin